VRLVIEDTLDEGLARAHAGVFFREVLAAV
jgi:hypothetical protein